VQTGITGWQAIKTAITSSKMTVTDGGATMTLAELEPHILAAEDARAAASSHAHDRITARHKDG
jgi:hypothetical protein